jgi:hypothetical protein
MWQPVASPSFLDIQEALNWQVKIQSSDPELMEPPWNLILYKVSRKLELVDLMARGFPSRGTASSR